MRNKETEKLLVNFDPSITQVIRETDCMLKMDLPVPENAKVIYQRQDQLKEYQHKLKVCFFCSPSHSFLFFNFFTHFYQVLLRNPYTHNSQENRNEISILFTKLSNQIFQPLFYNIHNLFLHLRISSFLINCCIKESQNFITVQLKIYPNTSFKRPGCL